MTDSHAYECDRQRNKHQRTHYSAACCRKSDSKGSYERIRDAGRPSEADNYFFLACPCQFHGFTIVFPIAECTDGCRDSAKCFNLRHEFILEEQMAYLCSITGIVA